MKINKIAGFVHRDGLVIAGIVGVIAAIVIPQLQRYELNTIFIIFITICGMLILSVLGVNAEIFLGLLAIFLIPGLGALAAWWLGYSKLIISSVAVLLFLAEILLFWFLDKRKGAENQKEFDAMMARKGELKKNPETFKKCREKMRHSSDLKTNAINPEDAKTEHIEPHNKVITLKLIDLEWINGPGDDPEDQCAHATVHFQINDTTFVHAGDGIWTVSATALYLLRTLESDNTSESPVAEGNFLFPCCARDAWPTEGKYKVIITGCQNGIDLQVKVSNDRVSIQANDGCHETISLQEWKKSVFEFSNEIKKFYLESAPKVESKDEEDRAGWKEFWREFETRLGSIDL